MFVVASPAGLAASWPPTTSPRPPPRSGAWSRPSRRPQAPPTWPTSSRWLRSRTTLPSAPPTALLSTCFVSTTKVRPTRIQRKLWMKPLKVMETYRGGGIFKVQHCEKTEPDHNVYISFFFLRTHGCSLRPSGDFHNAGIFFFYVMNLRLVLEC